MPLVLAVHEVGSQSATVPFSVILLQDHISNGKVPQGLKCRQLVPSSGAKSTSLWDVTDPEALKQWLDEAINVDVTHEVFEVQEEFAIGLGEVARARAAEKVMGGAKEVTEKTGRALGVAATTVGHQVTELDSKLKISESAKAAGTAIKESAVGRTAGAALGRVGSAVSGTTKKVLSSEKVHAAGEAVGNSFKKLGASLSSLTGRRGSTPRDGSNGVEHTPQFVQSEPESYAPPPSQTVYEQPDQPTSGSLRNPAAAAAAAPPAAAPVAAAVPAANGSPAAEQQRRDTPTFTLDDSESTKP